MEKTFNKNSNNKMKIEVNIESQLQELWSMIGLSEEEIEKEYENINDRIQELFRLILKENINKVRDLAQEAESKENQLAEALRCYGLEGVYHVNNQLPLKKRVENANEALSSIQGQMESQRKEFKYLYGILTENFDTLEIKPEDRGDFAEEGNNYSKAKIGRMTELLVTMKEIIPKRKAEMDDLCSKLSTYHQELDLPAFEPPKKLGDPTFKSLKKERNQLEGKLNQIQNDRKTLLKEIRVAESVLKIQPREVDENQICTQSELNSLRQYREELLKEKENRIPEFIDDAKLRLRALWNELHIIPPSRESFPFIYSEVANHRTLTALQAEIERLDSMKENIEPMLNLCNQRDAIIKESNRLNLLSNRSDRLTSRKSEMATSLIAEEKSRKQVSVDLPRINRQLEPMLIDFQDTYGEQFLWDGEVLIDAVRQQIQDYEDEKSLYESKQQRRNSPSKSKITRTPNSTFSPRTPK